jgi:starch phosphorylase
MTPNTPPTIPERIRGLADVANNLSWSWHREARALFLAIDANMWHLYRHNPVDLLNNLDPMRLASLATDPDFLERYDAVMRWYAAEMSFEHTWFSRAHPDLRPKTIAYFCAEFGFHSSVPIYSGGLGILAGDHCKSASDLGVPLVGVGILLSRGLLRPARRASTAGRKTPTSSSTSRIRPSLRWRDPPANRISQVVKTFGRDVYVRASRLMVGRTPIILLDADLEQNHADDRQLLSKLYAGGPRLSVFARSGCSALAECACCARSVTNRPRGIPTKGHAAFMLVERLRELTAAGMEFDEAVAAVRAPSTFTTHTPVPAGHDTFDRNQITSCTGRCGRRWGLTPTSSSPSESTPVLGNDTYHMTATAIRLSRARQCCLAQTWHRHAYTMEGAVAGRDVDDVPIGHIHQRCSPGNSGWRTL